jgi:cyclic pyranopterin phosphate synthase
MRKLRVSLTDHCNYRCFYCMPPDAKFYKKTEMLSAEQYIEIINSLTDLGLNEIRITGGEPTLSKHFKPVIEGIKKENISKLGLTSNAQLLKPHLDFLKEHGVIHLNISLDSLNADRFKDITHGGDFNKVLDCILTAKKMNFNVKLNCVVVGGVNDDELIDFVKFSEEHDIDVRFLEYMKIGPSFKNLSTKIIPQQTMMEWINMYSPLNRLETAIDSTSQVFSTPLGGTIGFISSETQPFCNTCSRLRLTSKGALRGCLFKEDEISLIDKTGDDLIDTLKKVIAFKPNNRIDHFEQSMHITGG